MLFFYVRHGDPIYDPDSLTPLGHRQADAVAKRLALYGIDKVYSSTSNRAILTSKPTCELLRLEGPEQLDFANENHAWSALSYKDYWPFEVKEIADLFTSPEVRDLGYRWYEHPEFAGLEYGKEINRVYDAVDDFFAKLGYEHDRYTGKYKITKKNDQRIALFAHFGFGMEFMSCLLDIPYPQYSTHFDMCHTGMTVIEFPDNGGFSIPKVLTLSSDSHLYREGLPTKYNRVLYF